jgi:predicted metal-dependent hydrolase
MVRGESDYFLGRYRLRVIQQCGASKVVLRNRSAMELHVPPGTSAEQRERVLLRWYRQKLKELIPPLVEKWQSVLGVEVADWGIKKMKTK